MTWTCFANVQVANLYGGGADKLPMDKRAAFAEEQIEHIMQTAYEPLNPQHTWCANNPC